MDASAKDDDEFLGRVFEELFPHFQSLVGDGK